MRKKKAIPVKEWWKKEQQKVLNKEFSVWEVKDMHRDCLRWDRYREDFTGFWQTGKDFQI